jgi:hypothetical protein
MLSSNPKENKYLDFFAVCVGYPAANFSSFVSIGLDTGFCEAEIGIR